MRTDDQLNVSETFFLQDPCETHEHDMFVGDSLIPHAARCHVHGVFQTFILPIFWTQCPFS